MGILTISNVLEKAVLPVYSVEVPEWKGTILIQVLSADERNKIGQKYFPQSENDKDEDQSIEEVLDQRQRKLFVEDLFMKSIVNEDRTPLFTKKEQVNQVFQNAFEIADRLMNKILEYNGMTKEAVEEAKKN